MLPVLFVILWASGFVVGKLGVEAAPPLGLLVVRFIFALPLIILVALRTPNWRQAPFKRLLIIGMLLQGVQFAGVYTGLSLGVPPALSSLIILGLAPVATTALATATGLERPSPRVWLLLAIGVGGVALSVAPELGSSRVGAGAALTVLGMFALATGTVLQKRWPADPRISAPVQAVAGAVLIVPLAAGLGQLDIHPSVKLAWTAAWLGCVLSLGAIVLFVHLLSRYDASTVSALLLVVPAVTAVEAALVLGESLQPLSLAGLVVTTVAVLGVVRLQRAPAPGLSGADGDEERADGTAGSDLRPGRASGNA